MTDPEEIDLAFIPQRSQSLAEVILDGEAVLYQEEHKTVHVLNMTATLVWARINGETDIETACRGLAALYSVDIGDIRRDVLEAIRDFARRGLLHGVQPVTTVIEQNLLSGTEVE
jgi:hypothetical protein